MADERVRVLFLIPTLHGGGAERVIVTLLRHLDRDKFRAVLAVVDCRHAAYFAEVPGDIEFIDLHCSRVRFALPRIVRLIWRTRPDVVFSTLGHLNLALALIRGFLPNGVRYVGREVCVVSEALTTYPHRRLWRWAYRRFYSRFDIVVCQSADMREDLIRQFGFPPHKAMIIHNPIDLATIERMAADPIAESPGDATRSSSSQKLVAAGRLTHQKGFDLLIEALASCPVARPHLILLGEGPLRSALEHLAKERGVAERVHFAGFKKNPYPFFRDADAFVLSSRFEGFPNVVLEALACGAPVIATPAPGGVAEIAELAGGVTVASRIDAEALSIAIERFYRGERSAGAITLKPFLVDRIVDQYQKLFVEVALKARPA